jgi:hypothetical protein
LVHNFPALLRREVMPETFVVCFDAIPLKESCSRWKLPWLSQTLKMQNLHVFGRRLAKGLLHVSVQDGIRRCGIKKSRFSSQSGYHRKPLSLDVRESNFANLMKIVVTATRPAFLDSGNPYPDRQPITEPWQYVTSPWGVLLLLSFGDSSFRD